MSVADFPADYAYGDGKDEGFSTPNFPLGEFANAEAREAAEKAGTSSVEASWCCCLLVFCVFGGYFGRGLWWCNVCRGGVVGGGCYGCCCC